MIEEQDFRKFYAYGEKYPLYVPNDYLIPFFLQVNANITQCDVEFYRLCNDEGVLTSGLGAFSLAFSKSFDTDGGVDTFSTRLKANGLMINASVGNTIIAYIAKEARSLDLPKGVYYMKLKMKKFEGGEIVRYSDIFFVESRANLSKKVHITWGDDEDLYYADGLIPYSSVYNQKRFRNEVFLDSAIGKPTYSTTEEGEERDGYFFPIKQISEKTFNFKFFAPEYLCDAMRLIRLSDHIHIVDDMGRDYDCDTFEMDVNWAEQGHYAEVECSFQTDTIIKKIAKSYNN